MDGSNQAARTGNPVRGSPPALWSARGTCRYVANRVFPQKRAAGDLVGNAKNAKRRRPNNASDQTILARSFDLDDVVRASKHISQERTMLTDLEMNTFLGILTRVPSKESVGLVDSRSLSWYGNNKPSQRRAVHDAMASMDRLLFCVHTHQHWMLLCWTRNTTRASVYDSLGSTLPGAQLETIKGFLQ